LSRNKGKKITTTGYVITQKSIVLNDTARLEQNTGLDTYITIIQYKTDFSFLTTPCISGSTFSLNGLHNCILEFLLFSRESNNHAENTICPSKPK
jgi:hypothetical protein